MKIENEKAAPGVTSTEDGGEQTRLDGFDELPASESITRPYKAQGVIAPLLLHGETNAIPLGVLETLTGLDRRLIRRRIQAERQAGVCICVNNRDGYFLAENEAERARCVASMRRRAAEVYRTADAIARAGIGGCATGD